MNTSERNLKIYDRILATVSAMAIIIGGIWTLTGFIQAKNAENNARIEQIRLNIFNDKKLIYYELSDAEAEIAACNSYDEVVIAQKHFRKLYCGRAHLISGLDAAVNQQKKNFLLSLDKYLKDKPPIKPFNYFGDSSLNLVNICRHKLIYK